MEINISIKEETYQKFYDELFINLLESYGISYFNVKSVSMNGEKINYSNLKVKNLAESIENIDRILILQVDLDSNENILNFIKIKDQDLLKEAREIREINKFNDEYLNLLDNSIIDNINTNQPHNTNNNPYPYQNIHNNNNINHIYRQDNFNTNLNFTYPSLIINENSIYKFKEDNNIVEESISEIQLLNELNCQNSNIFDFILQEYYQDVKTLLLNENFYNEKYFSTYFNDKYFKSFDGFIKKILVKYSINVNSDIDYSNEYKKSLEHLKIIHLITKELNEKIVEKYKYFTEKFDYFKSSVLVDLAQLFNELQNLNNDNTNNIGNIEKLNKKLIYSNQINKLNYFKMISLYEKFQDTYTTLYGFLLNLTELSINTQIESKLKMFNLQINSILKNNENELLKGNIQNIPISTNEKIFNEAFDNKINFKICNPQSIKQILSLVLNIVIELIEVNSKCFICNNHEENIKADNCGHFICNKCNTTINSDLNKRNFMKSKHSLIINNCCIKCLNNSSSMNNDSIEKSTGSSYISKINKINDVYHNV